MTMRRRVLAVLIGLVAGAVVIALLEMVAQALYPLPGVGRGTTLAEYGRVIRETPAHQLTQPLLALLLAHVPGGLLAGFVTAAIATANRSRYSLISGAILLLLSAGNMLVTPHPSWFMILELGQYLPSAWLGGKLAQSLFPTPTALRSDDAAATPEAKNRQ